MRDWKEIPRDIILWEESIDKIVFIDENNISTIKNIIKKIKNKQSIEKTEQFFTLTGCLINESNYQELKHEFEFIKFKYWKNAEFHYQNKNKKCKVCFHSREIRMKQNAFGMLEEKYGDFLKDISNVIQKVDFKIITVNINLKKMAEKSPEEEIYKYAFNKLISKFYAELGTNQKGIVVLEARGKKEDKNLHNYAVELIEKNYESKIKGVYFNSKWNKEKSVTYSGLELVDLCTYPIHKKIRDGKEDFAFKILKPKIIGYLEDNDVIKKFP